MRSFYIFKIEDIFFLNYILKNLIVTFLHLLSLTLVLCNVEKIESENRKHVLLFYLNLTQLVVNVWVCFFGMNATCKKLGEIYKV
jgi:hypothetical protein